MGPANWLRRFSFSLRGRVFPACFAATLSGSASGARLPLPRCTVVLQGRPSAPARDARPQGSTHMNSHNMHPPREAGLYDPRFEHDACGVGMVARLDNQPTHEVVTRAITALENLEHRGATGADPCTGDGAGILMQMPDELFRAVAPFELPAAGTYGVLMCFLPSEDARRGRLQKLLEDAVAQSGQRV